MKWGEFKKMIETEGVTDDYKISWIDFNGFDIPKIKIDTRSQDGTIWFSVK